MTWSTSEVRVKWNRVMWWSTTKQSGCFPFSSFLTFDFSWCRHSCVACLSACLAYLTLFLFRWKSVRLFQAMKISHLFFATTPTTDNDRIVTLFDVAMCNISLLAAYKVFPLTFVKCLRVGLHACVSCACLMTACHFSNLQTRIN